jgi:hypothetical protein
MQWLQQHWHTLVGYLLLWLTPSPLQARVCAIALTDYLKGRTLIMDTKQLAAVAASLKPAVAFAYGLALDLLKAGSPEQHKASVVADVKVFIENTAVKIGGPLAWVVGLLPLEQAISKLYDEAAVELAGLETAAEDELKAFAGLAAH